MRYDNIPVAEHVTATLVRIGGTSTARELCDKIVDEGYPRPDTQLGIQRTVERGMISILDDWTLSTEGNADLGVLNLHG